MSRVERNKDFYTKNEKPSPGRGAVVAGHILSAIGTLIMVLVIVLCLGIAIPKFAGYGEYVVISGSMEPEIPVGSIVYSKPVNPVALQPGDIIVFFNTDQRDSVPITHRVVENHNETGEIITKGDANDHTDLQPIAYINIVGKVFAHIPKLGLLASTLASTAGKIGVALVIIAGYLLAEVGVRLKQ